MEKFIPYEKLSKKKKRELDQKRRGSWNGLNPVTRMPPNPKAYNRQKARKWNDDSSPCFLCFLCNELFLPDRDDGNIIEAIGSLADSHENLAENLTPVGMFS